MKNPTKSKVGKCVAMLLAFMAALLVLVPHGSASAQDRPAFSQGHLEQTLAPIALYPDALLSQILMASTYPLEVVEAARWSRAHANSSGEDAVRVAGNEDWDPSVKSLLAFPHVLARMDEDLQWLQTLGDAFLDQEPQVMDAVQNLRRRAQLAGNLRSDERQHVLATGPLLVVQPANPQIIMCPTMIRGWCTGHGGGRTIRQSIGGRFLATTRGRAWPAASIGDHRSGSRSAISSAVSTGRAVMSG